MNKSQRLRTADIRDVFHLLGEITELGRDPDQWRLHLLQKSLPLIGARVGAVCEHYINPENPADTRLVGLVELGWIEDQQQRFYSYLNSGGIAQDPQHIPVQRMLYRSFTRRRRDFVSDELWYSSPVVDPLRRQCNVDDHIYSRWRLPQPGWAHCLSLMRAWGAAPYTERDRLLVSLLHRELGRLWAKSDFGPLASLPPRLRQTLDLIFSGYSEKQMGEALNVSAHTAHDFCRRLYRHFNVTSRGSLLTNPSCRQLLFRPALSPAYYAQRRGITEGTFPEPT
jgi:DNA-binding CsgD family transcriptional regulator